MFDKKRKNYYHLHPLSLLLIIFKRSINYRLSLLNIGFTLTYFILFKL